MVSSCYQSGYLPTIAQLQGALTIILDYFDTTFIIVDAVDESQTQEVLAGLLRVLRSEHQFQKIRLLATSREYSEIEQAFDNISRPISMDNPLLREDIRLFIRSSLASRKNFCQWPRKLRDDVENALTNGAKGM